MHRRVGQTSSLASVIVVRTGRMLPLSSTKVMKELLRSFRTEMHERTHATTSAHSRMCWLRFERRHRPGLPRSSTGMWSRQRRRQDHQLQLQQLRGTASRSGIHSKSSGTNSASVEMHCIISMNWRSILTSFSKSSRILTCLSSATTRILFLSV